MKLALTLMGSSERVRSAIAALDCGTNSTRLLITTHDGKPLVREMTITRLGQGVDADGALREEAIERVLTALRRYKALMNEHEVDRARMACTSAVRDAGNGADFLERASKVVGTPAELLSGDDEAALSFAGATADLDEVSGPLLVVDIGGGSTELVLSTETGLEAVSLQLGCVRLTERCLLSDPPTSDELSEANDAIEHQFSRVASALPSLSKAEPPTVIGLAGTVASIVLLEQAMTVYDRDLVHHQVVTLPTVQKWIERLSKEPVAVRRSLPGMEPGRADVLLGGLLVLRRVLGYVGATSLLTSEADILDGLIASQQ